MTSTPNAFPDGRQVQALARLGPKYACVHGHFYQPPRENPWLGVIEAEDSALPFHDWNAKIMEECYGPNAGSPFRNPSGRIEYLADNYRLMSFNFGPTLLSWLENRHPALLDAIKAADAESLRERGHGNALAQPYVHAILPLASARDKRTLVRWGIADFKARFRRLPEGMWLPETAVDEETLETLVAEGVRFTVLAPWQAAKVREPGGAWQAVDAATVDPGRAYRWHSRLQPGKELAVFFYFQGLAHSVIREGLADGPTLAARIQGRFRPDDSTQLVHIATDGEYWGHHNKKGDEALALAFRLLQDQGVAVVNYAQFLDLYPPPQEVEIAPDTSWSCPHGILRWKDDCGCKTSEPGWRQKWRRPLRDALDWLGKGLDGTYEKSVEDPWNKRDAYLCGSLEADAKTLPWLELQRHRLLMQTSCAWFFDDVSGLESTLALKHAARAMDLAASLGTDFSTQFKERLAKAPSNVAAYGDGAGVYAQLVEPLRVDFKRAAAHLALQTSLGATEGAFPFQVKIEQDLSRFKTSGESFYAARLELRWKDTLQSSRLLAVARQSGRLDMACWAAEGRAAEACPWSAVESLARAFDETDADAFRREAEALLGPEPLGIDALFTEERRKTLRRLVSSLPGSPLRDFLADWNRALGKLDKDPEAAFALLESCPNKGIVAQDLPGLDLLRGFFLSRFDALADAAPRETLSRLLRWLEVSESLALGLDPWQERFFFWRWRTALSMRAPGHPAELDVARALGARLGFAEAAHPTKESTTRC